MDYVITCEKCHSRHAGRHKWPARVFLLGPINVKMGGQSARCDDHSIFTLPRSLAVMNSNKLLLLWCQKRTKIRQLGVATMIVQIVAGEDLPSR